jgi:hypothetical protein
MKNKLFLVTIILWILAGIEFFIGVGAEYTMDRKKYHDSFFSNILPWVFVSTLLLSFFTIISEAIIEFVESHRKKKPEHNFNKLTIKTVAQDLVSVVPMDAPLGHLVYMDMDLVYMDLVYQEATPDLLADIYQKYLDNSKGGVEETKCYCGHTNECDCGPLSKEEFAEKLRSGDAAFIRKFINPAQVKK